MSKANPAYWVLIYEDDRREWYTSTLGQPLDVQGAVADGVKTIYVVGTEEEAKNIVSYATKKTK